MGWIGDRPRREPLSPRRKLFPVGVEAIFQATSTFKLRERGQGTFIEMEHVRERKSRFKSTLDLYFKEYKERDNSLGEWAGNAFMDGALFVHAIMRHQAPDELPRFSDADAPRLVQADMTAIKEFSFLNGIDRDNFERVAMFRIAGLKAKDDPEIGQELLDQYKIHPDRGPFLVGAMAAYFTINLLWTIKQNERERTRVRVVRLFRRRPAELEDPLTVLERLEVGEAQTVIFDESGRVPNIPRVRFN